MELTIIDKSLDIIKNGGAILKENQAKAEKATKVGENILGEITASGGITTKELDDKAQAYIAKCKERMKQMNDGRKFITQLFDQIKSEFTSAENALDPTKDTVVAKVQAARNAYAKHMAEVEEKKRIEAQAKLLKEKEVINLVAQISHQLDEYFQSHLSASKRRLLDWFNGLTLENFDEKRLDNYNPVYKNEHLTAFAPTTYSRILTSEEIANIRTNVLTGKYDGFNKLFKDQLVELKQDLQAKLPGKKKELEALAVAGELEKERIRIQAEQRQKEEQEKMVLEAEELRKKAEMEAKLKQEASITEALFAIEAEATIQQDAPETRRAKKIRVIKNAGYAQIFAFWWESEGKSLDGDKIENTKISQMIAYAEKQCNKNGTIIESHHVVYDTDYTAVNRKIKA